MNLVLRLLRDKAILLCVIFVLVGLGERWVALKAGGMQYWQEAINPSVPAKNDFVAIPQNLLTGKGFSRYSEEAPDHAAPTANRGPVIPFLYAFYFLVTGNTFAGLLIVRALEYIAGAAILYWACRVMFPDSKAIGVISVLLYCTVPHFVSQYVTWGEIGPLAIGLFWLMAESVMLLRKKRRWWVGGLIWGLAATIVYFMRPPAAMPVIVLIVLLTLITATRKRDWTQIARVALGSAVVLVSVSLWAARSHALFGQWFFGRSDNAANLWLGQHPQWETIIPDFPQDLFFKTQPFTMAKYGDPNIPETYGRYVETACPANMAYAWTREIREFYKAHPEKIVTRSLKKLVWTIDPRYMPVYNRTEAVHVDANGILYVNPAEIVPRPASQRIAHIIAWPVILIGIVAGLFIAIKRDKAVGLVYIANVFGFIALIMASNPVVKTRLPMEVSSYPLVALAAVAAWNWLCRRKSHNTQAARSS